MQCRDAQFYLRLRRQAGDELGTDVTADLDRHLAGCPACAADAGRAAGFDRAVASALRAVPVPAGLRDKLLAQASTQHGGVIRRKVYRVAALAASLFVGVGLAFGVFSASRPKIDTTALVMLTDEQIEDRDGRILGKWLADQKFPTELPLPFDPTLVIGMGTEQVQGQDVPVVTFAHPKERGFAFSLFQAPWGAFPGHTPQDVGSGIGVVHNGLMLEKAERTVVEAPFRVFPKPAWFVGHRKAGIIGRLLTAFEYRPGFAKLPRILWNALSG